MWEVACYFEYKFLNFDNDFFLSSKRCTSYLPQIWLHVKKIQPLLFAQGGCLEENLKANKRGTLKNMCEIACYFEHKFLNFDNKFFLSSKIFTFYISQIWLQVRNIYPYYLHKVAALEKK